MYIINYISSKLSNCNICDAGINCYDVEHFSNNNIGIYDIIDTTDTNYIDVKQTYDDVTYTSYLDVKQIYEDVAGFNAFDVVDIDADVIKNKCIFNGKFADTFMDDECNNVGLDLDILVDHSMILKCRNITTSEYCNYIRDDILCCSSKKMFIG